MNFSKLSLDELWESSCYNSFAAIEVNRDDFVSRFGEQQLLEFQDKLEHAGFSLAGSTKETLDKRGLSGSSKEASVPLPVEYF